MTTLKCGACGSEKTVSNLRVVTPIYMQENHIEQVQVEFLGNPDALIFKQAHREGLRANVCGDCGKVDLHVENPEALWAAHQWSDNEPE